MSEESCRIYHLNWNLEIVLFAVNADEAMIKNATSTFRSNNSQSLSQSSRSQSKGSRASKDDPGSDPATRYLSPPLSSATAAVYKVQEWRLECVEQTPA